jgi:DNA-binding NtrC family response regulator
MPGTKRGVSANKGVQRGRPANTGMEPTRLGKANSMQRTGSILVVDSDPPIVELLVEILTDEGYIAYAAPDGASALAAIARHPPALLLLDMRMPGMRGADLLAAVCGAGLATVPMVLMTTTPRDAAPLLVPDSIECMAKPFDLDDLLACVARHVQPAPAVGESPARRAHTERLTCPTAAA